jgi:hypothetical protein
MVKIPRKVYTLEFKQEAVRMVECGQRVSKAAWRKLLSLLDERRLLDWEEAFLDATFITAKKGARQPAKHVAGEVRSAWWWSTATAYLSECNLRPRRLPNAGSRRARWGKEACLGQGADAPAPICGASLLTGATTPILSGRG